MSVNHFSSDTLAQRDSEYFDRVGLLIRVSPDVAEVQRVVQEFAKRALPGKLFVSCRVTQVYQTGVCIYFYVAFYHKGVEHPSQIFDELERCARDEILRSGGSLSHHHGVGKLRGTFLPWIMSPTALEWVANVKRTVDPANVFGIANQKVSD